MFWTSTGCDTTLVRLTHLGLPPSPLSHHDTALFESPVNGSPSLKIQLPLTLNQPRTTATKPNQQEKNIEKLTISTDLWDLLTSLTRTKKNVLRQRKTDGNFFRHTWYGKVFRPHMFIRDLIWRADYFSCQCRRGSRGGVVVAHQCGSGILSSLVVNTALSSVVSGPHQTNLGKKCAYNYTHRLSLSPSICFPSAITWDARATPILRSIITRTNIQLATLMMGKHLNAYPLPLSPF